MFIKEGVVMDIFEILKKHNEKIDEDFKMIVEYLKSGSTTSIVDVKWNSINRIVYFKDDITKSAYKDLWEAVYGRTGVYIFRMTNTIPRPPKFDPVTGGSPINLPKPDNFDAGHALYVGKASDSFLDRIHPHFSNQSNGTGALKIKHLNRVAVASNIEVYAFLFDKKINPNSWIVAGSLETLMHTQYKPYVGNKRK